MFTQIHRYKYKTLYYRGLLEEENEEGEWNNKIKEEGEMAPVTAFPPNSTVRQGMYLIETGKPKKRIQISYN